MPDYTLPDLPYDPGALEPHYSGEIVELHHDKHHAAYVAGANATLERLAEARSSGEFGAIVGLEKTLAFNLSGLWVPRMASGTIELGSLRPGVSDKAGAWRSASCTWPSSEHSNSSGSPGATAIS